ncbi:MAG: hypothetical protein ACRDYD_14300 [Acidimicrobiales bacterium]
MTLDLSNNQAGANAVQYTFNFTTATAATLASVTMTVPTGTAGTPTVVAGGNVGIGAGTWGLAGTTLTYTVTTPAAVSAGIPIQLAVSGLDNGPAVSGFTSTVTTQSAGPTTVDTGTSAAVNLGTTDTAVQVNVAESTTFTSDTTSFTLGMDPTLHALADQSKAVSLNVKSNAGQGYTLSMKDAGLQTGAPVHTIPAANAGMAAAAAWPGPNHFGYSLTATGSGTPTPGGALGGALSYAGYTTAGENVVSATGPTGDAGDAIVVSNQVGIDYTTPAGHYTDTITYTVAPNY